MTSTPPSGRRARNSLLKPRSSHSPFPSINQRPHTAQCSSARNLTRVHCSSPQVPPQCIPIHANVTQYDWSKLAAAAQFDVIMMDPPWQVRGYEPNPSAPFVHAHGVSGHPDRAAHCCVVLCARSWRLRTPRAGCRLGTLSSATSTSPSCRCTRAQLPLLSSRPHEHALALVHSPRCALALLSRASRAGRKS